MKNSFKFIVVLIITLILFSVNIFAWGEEDESLRDGTIGLNVEAFGNTFFCGVNLEFGITDHVVIGAGFGFDMLVVLIGIDYHAYLKYYITGKPLDLYIVGSFSYFEGEVFALFDYADTFAYFGGLRAGIEWQTPFLFYFALEGGITTLFRAKGFSMEDIVPWIGGTIGIRI